MRPGGSLIAWLGQGVWAGREEDETTDERGGRAGRPVDTGWMRYDDGSDADGGIEGAGGRGRRIRKGPGDATEPRQIPRVVQLMVGQEVSEEGRSGEGAAAGREGQGH